MRMWGSDGSKTKGGAKPSEPLVDSESGRASLFANVANPKAKGAQAKPKQVPSVGPNISARDMALNDNRRPPMLRSMTGSLGVPAYLQLMLTSAQVISASLYTCERS